MAVSAPWGLGMSVNGTITLPAPLAANLAGQDLITDITNSGYSFSDGVNTYNQTNSVLEHGMFSTDASGAISGSSRCRTYKHASSCRNDKESLHD